MSHTLGEFLGPGILPTFFSIFFNIINNLDKDKWVCALIAMLINLGNFGFGQDGVS